MNERPELNRELNGMTFRNFYYLKQELVEFCRENALPVSGGRKKSDWKSHPDHRRHDNRRKSYLL